MNEEFSFFYGDDQTTITQTLLQTVFDTLPTGIKVLKAIRKDRVIVDFEYILVNNTARSKPHEFMMTGKNFLKPDTDTAIFNSMVSTVETGISHSFAQTMTVHGQHRYYNVKCVKFNDGVLLAYENITELKKTHDQQQKAYRILDTINSACYELDHNGNIIFTNRKMKELFNMSDEDVLGKNIWEVFPDARQSGCYAAIQENALDNKEFGQYEYVSNVLHKWISLSATPTQEGCIVLFNEIEDIKNAKEQLKEKTNRVKEDTHFIGQIVETTPDIIFIMDLNTFQIIYANRQVAADLGYTKQQIAAMKNPVLDIMHEEDLPAMIEHLRKMKTISTDDKVLEIQYRLKNADEGYSWFCDRNTVFKRNSKKVPVEKIGICQNITTRKKEEEEQQTSLSIIQQSEQVVAIGSWEYDILTDEFKWSDGMYRLFNMDKDLAVRPEIYLDYTPANERPVVDKLINSILHDFAPFEEIITLTISLHEKKIIKIKGVVQKDKKGNPLKVIGVDLDITQQVNANAEINNLYKTLVQKNQELQALDHEIKTFNIVSAHHYKETLQQLYTNLEYIVSKDARQLSDTGKANIRRAQSAIQKMHLLTDDINAYFNLYDMDVRLTPLDPNPIIKAVINSYKNKLEQNNASVEYTELPSFPSHPVLFSQLIGNLLDRAIRSRNLTVALAIKIRYSQADELNSIPVANKDTAYIIVSITDNGIGFHEEEAEKMFEIFHHISDNGKRRSSGVGLAICKKIMSLHNGFITAEGSPARGAIFNCYFPLNA